MYKLLIVEDEPTIRLGMESYVPWATLGFEVAASFPSGEEALEWLRSHPCDVVMTDIVMGQMSGLDMVSHLRERWPEIKVIILSGHSNFEYAKKAMGFGVFDYLLKPINMEELIQTFGKLKVQLDSSASYPSAWPEVDLSTSVIMQHSFIKNLLAGHVYSVEELETCLSLLGIDQSMIQYPFLSFMISLSPTSDQEELEDTEEYELHEEIGARLKNTLSSQSGRFSCYITKGRGATWNVVIFSRIERELRMLRDSVQRKILTFLESSDLLAQYDVSVDITHAVQHTVDLVNRFTTVSNTLNDTLPATALETEMYRKYLSRYRHVVIEIDIGQEERITSLVSNMASGLSRVSLEYARFIMKNLFSAISQEFQNRAIDVRASTDGKFDQASLYRANRLEDMMAFVLQAFLALSRELNSLEEDQKDRTLRSVIEYIRGNLSGDLTCNTLAEQFQMNPVYLSRTFKRKTGERLIDYVMRLRMELAVLLLDSNKYSVLQISQMVGYGSPSYFVTSFKRFTGCSPTEYCHPGWL